MPNERKEVGGRVIKTVSRLLSRLGKTVSERIVSMDVTTQIIKSKRKSPREDSERKDKKEVHGTVKSYIQCCVFPCESSVFFL